MEWALLPLKRYAAFSGRSRRKEYWLFILFTVIVSTVLSAIDSALGLGGTGRTGGIFLGARGGLLSSLFSLAMLIPSLAVAVRRLHDTDRSGWWLLLPVAPYIPIGVLVATSVARGQISWIPIVVLGLAVVALAVLLLVFMCLPGTAGPNRFGEDPLERSLDTLGDVFR